jgi:hypothetical protein
MDLAHEDAVLLGPLLSRRVFRLEAPAQRCFQLAKLLYLVHPHGRRRGRELSCHQHAERAGNGPAECGKGHMLTSVHPCHG